MGTSSVLFYKQMMMSHGFTYTIPFGANANQTKFTYLETLANGVALGSWYKAGWQSNKPATLLFRWRQQAIGNATADSGRLVLLLKHGRVKLLSAPTATNAQGMVGDRQVEVHNVAPSDVRGLIYVAKNTPFPGNNASITYAAPKYFQPAKTMCEGKGAFRTLMTVPFAPGRTFRTTPDGRSVAFTVDVASNVLTVRTSDTAPEYQDRHIVMIADNGKPFPSYDMSSVTNSGTMAGNFNVELDNLWIKAMGKPPVYNAVYDVLGGRRGTWTVCNDAYPKAFLPKDWDKHFKEIRLEVRPVVEVPNVE